MSPALRLGLLSVAVLMVPSCREGSEAGRTDSATAAAIEVGPSSTRPESTIAAPSTRDSGPLSYPRGDASMAPARPVRANAATETPDSARGVLALVGPEPGVLVLVPAGGVEAVALRGAQEPTLRRAVGLDVLVRGRWRAERVIGGAPTPLRGFDVEAFAVRGSEGERAIDGVLLAQADRFTLLLDDGRRVALPAVPEGLRAHVGARVFLAGPLDRAPTSYGVLEPRREAP